MSAITRAVLAAPFTSVYRKYHHPAPSEVRETEAEGGSGALDPEPLLLAEGLRLSRELVCPAPLANTDGTLRRRPNRLRATGK